MTTAAQPARFATAQDAKTAILAGNATFTLVSVKTGTRFTYKITAAKDGGAYFAKVLTGSDNTNDYTYAGLATPRGVKPTANSAIGQEAPSVVALSWFLQKLAAGELPTSLEVWHTGRCCRCGRLLTVPESVAHGIGPDCAEKMAAGE